MARRANVHEHGRRSRGGASAADSGVAVTVAELRRHIADLPGDVVVLNDGFPGFCSVAGVRIAHARPEKHSANCFEVFDEPRRGRPATKRVVVLT